MRMRISVRVIPRAKQNSVEQETETTYRIRVTAPAHDGKANEAVISLLAKHFHRAKSRILLLSGVTARTKIFEIQ